MVYGGQDMSAWLVTWTAQKQRDKQSGFALDGIVSALQCSKHNFNHLQFPRDAQSVNLSNTHPGYPVLNGKWCSLVWIKQINI